jgi:hypothetical protein
MIQFQHMGNPSSNDIIQSEKLFIDKLSIIIDEFTEKHSMVVIDHNKNDNEEDKYKFYFKAEYEVELFDFINRYNQANKSK